jgi:dTDP-4-amino-4,6-dideoxygalactose transaminase
MTDDLFYKEYMLYSLHGQSKDALAKTQKGAWEYDILYPGYKCNMTDVLASIGIVQLKRHDELMRRRFELIRLYETYLDNSKIEIIKHYGENFRSSGHLLLCNLRGLSVEQRNELIIKLSHRGIATNVHYKPLPMFTAYKKLGLDIENFPNAKEKYINEITLPLHTLLTEDEIDYITQNINSML